MLKIILIPMLFLIALPAVCQVQAYKANSLSMKGQNDNNWTKVDGIDVLITIDKVKKKITIFSDNQQEFVVTNVSEPGGDLNTLQMACIDAQGTECIIKVVKKEAENQLVIDYSNLHLFYTMRKV